MVQVDLDSIKANWYKLGNTNTPISSDNHTLLRSLDSWQRKEVLDAYHKGSADTMTAWQA